MIRPGPTWVRGVAEMHGDRCLITGRGAQQAHHIVEARVLRRELQAIVEHKELRRILTDPRNGLPLTTRAHDLHTNWVKRIPKAALPESVFEFTEELDAKYGTRLSYWLSQEYV